MKPCTHLRFVEYGMENEKVVYYDGWDKDTFLHAFRAEYLEIDPKGGEMLDMHPLTSMMADGVIEEVESPEIQQVIFHYWALEGPDAPWTCYNAVNMYGFGKVEAGSPPRILPSVHM